MHLAKFEQPVTPEMESPHQNGAPTSPAVDAPATPAAPAAQDESPAEPKAPAARGSLFLDIFDLFFRPTALFARLPICNRATSAALVLIVCYVLYGLAVNSTGVYDYEIQAAAQKAITRESLKLEGAEDDRLLLATIDMLEQGARFDILFTRVMQIVAGPIRLLLWLGVIGGIMFVVVAMRGGKPNFKLVAGVAIFAGFIEVIRMLVMLLLISQLQVTRVETSAAAFVDPRQVDLGLYILLRRLNPFDIWYWVLLAMGLYTTRQIGRRGAIILVICLAVATALLANYGDVMGLARIKFLWGDVEMET